MSGERGLGEIKEEEERKTYERQTVRPFGDVETAAAEPYDSEEQWHLCLGGERWKVGDLGDKVWLTALYAKEKEG